MWIKICIDRALPAFLRRADCGPKTAFGYLAAGDADPLELVWKRRDLWEGKLLDTIIRGGDVVTPQGVVQCDVAISGETIAAVTVPGALPAQSAGRVIDASGSSYKTVQSLPTVKGARTMALDPVTGKIYLASAQYGPTPAATPGSPRPRPQIIPGSFTILVVSR